MLWNQPHVLVALSLCAVAAVFDARTREIPNWLTLPALALGPIWHLSQGVVQGGLHAGLSRLGLSALGIIVCGFFPALSFAKSEMGGGDVKLFAAIGGLCGPFIGFDAQAFTFLLTLTILLPVRLVRRQLLTRALANLSAALRNLVRPARLRTPVTAIRMPPVELAPWITLGLLLSLLRNGAFA